MSLLSVSRSGDIVGFVVVIRVVAGGGVGTLIGHAPLVNTMLSIAISLLQTPITASICS